ncbi:DNA cytosine methyltransferase [Nodularia harveyana UHCC-0300]|uniref:Cytosine-specific methyltransferase n=1 Tax=Nodularia harveyana UHCC-0300 TaxID=2974287 RepID=A0ABU5U9L7_9CYAN|nr:DNA cytosine methyltransferase [Nodularia harveyana]MEA5580208.1 DNA cytosine methyltransferase [Nodularia harveyana UHCC-0300]
MRRKDGTPKLKARRNLPSFEFGFKEHPNNKATFNNSLGKSYDGRRYSLMSFFCGCGGMDLGFIGGFRYLKKYYQQQPFHMVGAIDNSKDAVETYNLNLGEYATLNDLTKLNLQKLPKSDILLGGFPCQDFSSSGLKSGLEGKRGRLYQVMVDYMDFHKPAIVIGENVPHLSRLNGGLYLKEILNELEGVGYRFNVWDLYGPDYGLSQSRRRLFLVGVRDDLDGDPLKPIPTHLVKYVPIDTALSDLENIEDESIPNQSQYFIATRATSGGGQGDHTNKVGEVAYCIRANSRGRIQFHYKLNRRLTVRECARLQSFPDEFIFPYSTQRNLTLIGNAVPPMLAHKVATSVNNYLNNLTKQNIRIPSNVRKLSSQPTQLELAVGF